MTPGTPPEGSSAICSREIQWEHFPRAFRAKRRAVRLGSTRALALLTREVDSLRKLSDEVPEDAPEVALLKVRLVEADLELFFALVKHKHGNVPWCRSRNSATCAEQERLVEEHLAEVESRLNALIPRLQVGLEANLDASKERRAEFLYYAGYASWVSCDGPSTTRLFQKLFDEAPRSEYATLAESLVRSDAERAPP